MFMGPCILVYNDLMSNQRDAAFYTLYLMVILYISVSQTFFKWRPLSLVRTFYGQPYSWDYQIH